MDKKWKKLVKQIHKSNDRYPRGLAAVHWQINDRAELKERLDRVQVNGKVGVVIQGMDCDCCQYRREFVMNYPKSIFQFQHEEEKHRQYLDGPESCYYSRPDDVRDGYRNSSDRALEAYEDGHPHYVTLVDLS